MIIILCILLYIFKCIYAYALGYKLGLSNATYINYFTTFLQIADVANSY